MLRAGADKVAINTAAIKNPEIIKQSSRIFGSSTIIASIETIKSPDGNYYAYTDNGREYTGINIIEWSKKLEELGAGEIMLTSIDREGTGKGFDIDILKKIRKQVSIPLVAHGGFGSHEHISEAILQGGANGVALSSLIHYGALFDNNFQDDKVKEGNFSFLRNLKKFNSFGPMDIKKIKNNLKNKFEVRI